MKKPLIILFIVVIFQISSLGAFDNQQKIYPIDSEVYSAMEKLYILEGHALPSNSGPWSEQELSQMLDKIDCSSTVSKNLYEWIEEKLSIKPKTMMGEEVGMSFNFNMAIEGYYHENTEIFNDEHFWVHGFLDRAPFFLCDWETWSTDNIYIYFEAGLMNSLGNQHNNIDGNRLYKNTFTTNIPFLPPAEIGSDADFTFPYRSFASFGAEHWNLSIGRDRLGWGPGQSGNFMLGSHFIQHDFAKFTTYHEKFKYTLLAAFYPPDASMGEDQDTEIPGFSMLLAHRIEFRFLKDKIGLALSESVIYKTKENTLNLATINPFGFFHNEYIRGMANSLITAELDFNPFGAVDFYGQFAIDEFPLGETTPPNEGAYPSAFAYMLGVKTAIPVSKYLLKTSLEFALTDPFLYIRGLRGQTPNGYGYDAILKSFNKPGDYKRMFLGYEYGNDVVLVNFEANLEDIGVWSLDMNAILMWHGNKRLDSPWSVYGYNGQDELVTVLSGDVIEKTFILSFEGKVNILKIKGLYLKANVDYVNIVNMKSSSPTIVTYYGKECTIYLNEESNNQDDIQLSLGMGYSF